MYKRQHLGCLAHPGEFSINGTPVDLGTLDCDKLFVGGISDHITPWRACYRSVLSYGGDNEFVLSNSGHIQTLLNSPSKKRVSYFINPELPEDPDNWLEGASFTEGSWWGYWRAWLQQRSLKLKAAPKKLGNSHYPAGAPAPGTYVFQKSE